MHVENSLRVCILVLRSLYVPCCRWFPSVRNLPCSKLHFLYQNLKLMYCRRLPTYCIGSYSPVFCFPSCQFSARNAIPPIPLGLVFDYDAVEIELQTSFVFLLWESCEKTSNPSAAVVVCEVSKFPVGTSCFSNCFFSHRSSLVWIALASKFCNTIVILSICAGGVMFVFSLQRTIALYLVFLTIAWIFTGTFSCGYRKWFLLCQRFLRNSIVNSTIVLRNEYFVDYATRAREDVSVTWSTWRYFLVREDNTFHTFCANGQSKSICWTVFKEVHFLG